MSYKPNDLEVMTKIIVANAQTVTAQKVAEMTTSGVKNATGTSSNLLGVAKTSGSSGDIVSISYGPEIDGFTGLTQGSYYYLANDGSISLTPGTITKKIALALSATKIRWLNATV
jgi:hypothetical protein